MPHGSQHKNDPPISSPSPLAELTMRWVCHLIDHTASKWIQYSQSEDGIQLQFSAERLQVFRKAYTCGTFVFISIFEPFMFPLFSLSCLL